MTELGEMTSARIFQERMRKSMSVARLGELLGVNRRSVYRYEGGDRIPCAVTLVQLSKIFGVSVDYLLGLDSKRRRF